MKPRTIRSAALILPFLLCTAAAAAVDRARIIDHIRRQFSVPNDIAMKIGDLKPSSMSGYLTGKLSFKGTGPESSRDIQISDDGRYYFLASLFEVQPSPIPGLNVARLDLGAQGQLPIYFSPDKKHVFLGAGISSPQDASIDPDKANIAKIILKNIHARGPENAPVTLVEFSDLQCPACKFAHEMLSDNLEKTYGRKVRWVSKHYPLRSRHPWAYDAAVAASCAGMESEKGFNALQDAYFKNQKEITEANFREKTLGFAGDAKLKMESFTRCFDKKESAKLVDADISEGDSLEVSSTPTIFINGRRLGGLDFKLVQDIVDEMLKSPSPE